MNEKEARKQISNWVREERGGFEVPFEYYHAKGYLEAIEKAKGLADALEEMYDDGCCWDTYEEEECGECGWCHSKQALETWKAEK